MNVFFIDRRRFDPTVPSPATRRFPFLFVGRLLAKAAVAGLALCAWSAAAKVVFDFPLVVTQVPVRPEVSTSGWNPQRLVRDDRFDGAVLSLIASDGQVRVLSEGFESARDPNVSFDGQRVLFAGRKDHNARWRIWEIGVNGQGLRAITPETLDARSPIYVSTLFTLNSPQPWQTIVFVGLETTASETGLSATSNLYSIKLDGGELRRLTYNQNQNVDPFQMWDGRVIYAAERYSHEPAGAAGRVGLFAIHIEGADIEAYGGERGERVEQMPCATVGGLVVFVESESATWDGAGQLAWVEQRRPHVTYHASKKDGAHRYRYPSPLQENQVLVSQRDARGKGTWAIVRFDANTGAIDPVFGSKDYHVLQAVAVRPRAQPDGHSTVVTTADNYGTLYGLDCYTTDAVRTGRLAPGEVKRVRLIEGVPATPGVSTSPLSPATPRRLIGEAPVEADGSFNLFVPSDTPLLVQTVDSNGLSLGTCGWIWVKPQEKRGCIGCHEDPERVPENKFVLALHHNSLPLLAPAAERRTVTFTRDVAPLLLRCLEAGLLDARQQPLHLSLATPADLQAAYQVLTQGPDALVEPGRARTSRLIWQLIGRNTSRPWDSAAEVKTPPPNLSGAHLGPDELQTLILWIDLGAAYDAPATLAPSGKETAEK